jgi:hypothetical protein
VVESVRILAGCCDEFNVGDVNGDGVISDVDGGDWLMAANEKQKSCKLYSFSTEIL